MNRRFLNGETWLSKPQSSYTEYIGICREPPELKHLSRERKRKKHRFRKQRRANAEEPKPECVHSGVWTAIWQCEWQQKGLGSPAIESESLVHEIMNTPSSIRSTTRHEKPCGKAEGPPSKAKYYSVTDRAQYCEGKVKRTPGGE